MMTRYASHWVVIQLILLTVALPSLAQQDLLDYQNTLKFARYLSNTNQYQFAAQEYERMNYLWPDDTLVIKELVKTYRLGSACEKFPFAYRIMSEQGRLWNHPAMAREYLRFCLTCQVADPQFHGVNFILEPGENAFYRLGYYWATEQYDSAFSFNRLAAGLLSGGHPALHGLTSDFEAQKFKKPWLAMSMSALLPGSGKAYSGRWGDAAISFVFISTSAFASYRAFNRKGIRSVNGWLFGAVAVSFYSSNIYGSLKAARNHNEDVRSAYRENAKRIIYSNF